MSTDIYPQYAQNGYYVARGVFNAEEVAQMLAHYMEMNQTADKPGDFVGVPRKSGIEQPDPLAKYPRPINMHTWDKKTATWAGDARLTERAAILLQQQPTLIQTMLYYKPPGARGQSRHQDNLYIRRTPILGVWVALDRADAENGAMEVVPGTHLLGLLPARLADTDLSFTDDETLTPPWLSSVLVEMEPGDVLFFGGLTLHGSQPNRTTDRFRRSFICHYEGELAYPMEGPLLPSQSGHQ